MAANAPANPNALAVAQGGTVTVIEDPGIEYNLDAFPTDRFNRVIPTQTIRVPSDLVVPVVNVVQLNPDTRNGGDIYTSRDIGEGKAALTRVGLRKVATAAEVAITSVRRTDDGTDPGVCSYEVRAEMTLPTGKRIPAIGTKTVVLADQTWASDAQRRKYQSAFHEHVAARAENRAIRALLSIRGSYPEAELRKPFAVVTFAANMSHPEIRAQAIAAMVGNVQSAYGPGPTPELTAPEAPLQLPESVADEDDRDLVIVQTNGHATVERATGEIVTERVTGGRPDWFGADDAGALEFGDGATATPPSLAQRLQAIAEQHADATGAVDEARQRQVSSLLRTVPDSWSPGVHAAFDLGPKALQLRHAIALLEVAQAMGPDAFREAWVAMAAGS